MKPEWYPNSLIFQPPIGLHLVTVKVYDSRMRYDGMNMTSAAHWTGEDWLEYMDEDVIAWAEMPELYTED